MKFSKNGKNNRLQFDSDLYFTLFIIVDKNEFEIHVKQGFNWPHVWRS
jgi:hypothetical protein